jgi:AAA family ATP:ADP antiporter
LFPTAGVIYWVLIGLRALNYSLNHPVREVLYIPTTKDVKFKAKAWNEAFGTRIAKNIGSVANLLLKGKTPAVILASGFGVCCGFISVWLMVVYFLGKALQDALDNQRVIGKERENTKC